jgi:cell wall-associated NlpC family hydrolase
MTWIAGAVVGLVALIVAGVVLLGAVIAQMPWLAGQPTDGLQVSVSVAAVPTPAPAAQASAPRTPVPTLVVDQPSSALIERTIAQGMTWLGVPYQWGGCTRAGVDCSCLMDNILLVGAGIHAPRVTTDLIRWAMPVGASAMRRGDLLFFRDTCTGCGGNPTHVGMYLGGGEFLQAGDPVQVTTLSGYYAAHFQAAGRPVGF